MHSIARQMLQLIPAKIIAMAHGRNLTAKYYQNEVSCSLGGVYPGCANGGKE